MSKDNDLRGQGWVQAKLAVAYQFLEDCSNQSSVKENRALKLNVDQALASIASSVAIAYEWYDLNCWYKESIIEDIEAFGIYDTEDHDPMVFLRDFYLSPFQAELYTSQKNQETGYGRFKTVKVRVVIEND